MFAYLLALMLPVLQVHPNARQLSTRWHPTVAIETGLSDLAFISICPTTADSAGQFFAVDSAGNVAELAFINREWKVMGRTSIGEDVVTGCSASMRPDEVWSLIVGTESGKVIELRRGVMGWGQNLVTTAAAPIKSLRATEPGRPGPSQLFVIDANGLVTDWYVGASGRWNAIPLPSMEGGSTHICFDYRREGLNAVAAGPKGIIYKFAQDTMGQWAGGAWDTLSSGCRDLAAASDPTGRDICVLYSGMDGHLRYLFFQQKSDVDSRLRCAEGAFALIGKGDQRRYNEFFGMAGNEFCLFEFNTDQRDWIKVPIRSIPSSPVSTVFGPARGATVWHTIYVATLDGKIYEIERDGVENE